MQQQMGLEKEEEFLLKCNVCGKPFFTLGEKNFYESKGLNMPKRCKPCRLKNARACTNYSLLPASNALDMDIVKLYDEILNGWSVEAKKENSAYFYNVKEVQIISEGKKSFVIGRKGSGKTAIAQHLCEIEQSDIFAATLSFKNFPFNVLYSLENKKAYTVPNQYISIWKYLIYTYICKQMVRNQNVDLEVRNKLGSLYGDKDINSLDKSISKWTSKSFGVKIFGLGFNCARERQDQEITWIDATDILEQIILDHCDSAKYFIIFDELDEDYKDFITENERNDYMWMLTSLFKAVQYIRNVFERADKKILPVVFLRSDIYTCIKDSDKNKWNESVINLEWDSSEIQRMMAHRLNVASHNSKKGFDEIWHSLFSRERVEMGNRQSKKMDIFTYIERSTEMRPRDYIRYVQECVSLSKDRCEYPISPQTVRDADDNFSEYLKQETIDETFAVIPEINDILGLLSTIRKQSFQFHAFEKEYNELVKRKVVHKGDVKSILLILFDAGVIGNKPTMSGQSIFRFSKKSPRFNFNETMLVHRGLYKALQIF